MALDKKEQKDENLKIILALSLEFHMSWRRYPATIHIKNQKLRETQTFFYMASLIRGIWREGMKALKLLESSKQIGNVKRSEKSAEGVCPKKL